MLRGLVLLTLVSATLAALYIRDLDPKPAKYENVPGCYIKELDEVVPVGGRRPGKQPCQEYFCNEDSVSVGTCGAVAAEAPCTIVPGDQTQAYPKCCQQPSCPVAEPEPPGPSDCYSY